MYHPLQFGLHPDTHACLPGSDTAQSLIPYYDYRNTNNCRHLTCSCYSYRRPGLLPCRKLLWRPLIYISEIGAFAVQIPQDFIPRAHTQQQTIAQTISNPPHTALPVPTPARSTLDSATQRIASFISPISALSSQVSQHLQDSIACISVTGLF